MKRMKDLLRKVIFAGLLLALCFIPAFSSTAHMNDEPEQQIVGYFTAWGIYGRNYLVKNIVTSGTSEKLTVINYAFANVVPDANGQVVCKLGDEWADFQKPWTAEQSVDGIEVNWPNPLLGNFQQLKQLKSLYPNIRVLISLGGWTWSKYFSDAALTPESRTAFVQSCVDLFIKGNLPEPGWGGMGGPGSGAGVFDGIDVDWEYPAALGDPGNIYRDEDTQNFTALLAEFRRQLNEVQPGLLLTIAAPAAESKYSKIELDEIPEILDWINVMTYDFHGAWDSDTNFHANLNTSRLDPSEPPFSVDDTVQGYLNAGVPGEKIVIGVPFYGRGWTGVQNVKRGLYQKAAGPAPGVWEAGVNDYKVLKTLVGTDNFKRFWDPKTDNAWLFNGETFWTFDDEKTIRAKTKYINAHDLGGVMFWELSGDDPDGTLVSAIFSGLSRKRP